MMLQFHLQLLSTMLIERCNAHQHCVSPEKVRSLIQSHCIIELAVSKVTVKILTIFSGTGPNLETKLLILCIKIQKIT